MAQREGGAIHALSMQVMMQLWKQAVRAEVEVFDIHG